MTFYGLCYALTGAHAFHRRRWIWATVFALLWALELRASGAIA